MWKAAFRPGSLARRYVTLLGIVTLTLLVAASASEMVFGYREARQHIGQLQRLQAAASRREIEQYLRGIEAGLRDVGKFPWGQPSFGMEERRDEWHRLLVMQPAILELQLVGADGMEQLSVSRTSPDRRAGAQRLPELALLADLPPDTPRYGTTFNAEGGDPLVRVAMAEQRGTGLATVATLNLRFLADVVSGLRVGQDGNTYLVDSARHLIAHPRPSEVLRQRDLSGFEPVQLATAGAAAASSPGLNAVDTIDFNGRPVITTSTPLKQPDWTLFVEQPRSEAMVPVLAVLQRSSALLAFGVLLAVATSAVFARRMAAPIVALRQATARIAEGELETTLKLLESGRQDEIEDLAQDFNRMVERLRESYASLEAKVADRTAELSVRKDEAERANTAKTRFLAAASHDLRQPMHSISLLMGVLRSRLQEPAHTELADKVQASVAAMERLFGNLLDISKLDAGAVQVHLEDVPLSWLLERVGQTWAPQAAEKGLALKLRPCSLAVRGDATLLERIVSNLVSNAIRYTRSGGVLVACRRRGREAVLEVWDSGPGIAPEHRQAIFEEFYRIEAPGTGSEKGLGLGLSIVQRCAQLLGYELAVESRVGRGTVFRLRMPLAASAALPALQAPGAGAEAAALAGNFVAVVDDDETNRLALRDALLGWQCHVVAAASGDELLALLEDHLRVPDLLVTDYQLGAGQRGVDVIEALRAAYDEPIPALIVTANTDAGLQAEAQALGAGLLHKPVGLQRLLEAMLGLLKA